MDVKLISKSAGDTKRLAARLAKETLRALVEMPQALIMSLEGDLGAGKTTFVQGFAKGLGIRQRILSPTFVLMKKFAVPRPKPSTLYPLPYSLYHIDCYRLDSPKALLELGWKEIAREPGNIVLVEWGDRVRGVLPNQHTTLTFAVTGVRKRLIVMTAPRSKSNIKHKKSKWRKS